MLRLVTRVGSERASCADDGTTLARILLLPSAWCSAGGGVRPHSPQALRVLESRGHPLPRGPVGPSAELADREDAGRGSRWRMPRRSTRGHRAVPRPTDGWG